MHTKRILSLLLAALLLVSLLTACDNKTQKDPAPSDSDTVEDTDQTPEDSLPPDHEPDVPDDKQDDPEDTTQPPEDPDQPADAPALLLDRQDFTLFQAGATYQITATGADTPVTWVSSNEKIATVSEQGVVTAVAPGNVTITATAGDLSATCIVRCNWKEASSADRPAADTTSIDLSAFLTTVESTYADDMPSLTTLDDELIANYLPDLANYTLNQCIVKTAMISAVVGEFVLIECANADDVESVKAVLQARIDAQVDGGAWYPESIEGWKTGKVVSNGNYIMMAVCPGITDRVIDDFNALF